MFDISKIEYKNHNERDVEVPAFLDFLKDKMPISSLLDVGACYSYYAYANDVKNILDDESRYDGVDVLNCEKTAAILDCYILGNVRTVPLNTYEVVSCISTIEHSGISSYKAEEYQAEQLAVFERICELSKKYFYVSFPFGAEGIYPNEYSNITESLLVSFEDIASKLNFETEARFFYNEFPQGRKTWAAIERAAAGAVPLAMDKGVQCVCLLTGSRKLS